MNSGETLELSTSGYISSIELTENAALKAQDLESTFLIAHLQIRGFDKKTLRHIRLFLQPHSFLSNYMGESYSKSLPHFATLSGLSIAFFRALACNTPKTFDIPQLKEIFETTLTQNDTSLLLQYFSTRLCRFSISVNRIREDFELRLLNIAWLPLNDPIGAGMIEDTLRKKAKK